ncbi:Ctr-domain-containing protein [Hyaloscypha hepaticicola]|uniref:Copper transport protein n=1 Tax=Hyaloscypha hepaticicola TaxID=2082293 RepID=A0A2J6Q2A3_9HELO|nr:Ctr-domain-containing protein [Hyaloscypha hepaticicola]
MDMTVHVPTPSAAMSMSMSTSASAMAATATAAMSMPMEDSGGCKLSMLLNWHTIDACFLSSTFHIRSSFTFFLSCFAAFLLVISLGYIRRAQRNFDRYLQARNAVLQDEEYALPEETEQKLLPNGSGREKLMRKLNGRTTVAVLEQLLRGLIHTVQFSVSYCIMLLFMYSNGYIIISILVGALVGFALFTRDTLNYRPNHINDIEEQEKICC